MRDTSYSDIEQGFITTKAWACTYQFFPAEANGGHRWGRRKGFDRHASYCTMVCNIRINDSTAIRHLGEKTQLRATHDRRIPAPTPFIERLPRRRRIEPHIVGAVAEFPDLLHRDRGRRTAERFAVSRWDVRGGHDCSKSGPGVWPDVTRLLPRDRALHTQSGDRPLRRISRHARPSSQLGRVVSGRPAPILSDHRARDRRLVCGDAWIHSLHRPRLGIVDDVVRRDASLRGRAIGPVQEHATKRGPDRRSSLEDFWVDAAAVRHQ